LSVKHSNTVKSRRNIFIEDGMVMFVTEYHKGYSVGGDVKIIHRYLPREIGELLVYYLWLVLPFQQQVSVEEWQTAEISLFLWGGEGDVDMDGKAWTTEGLKKIIKRESATRMGP
jgi:hypothetical protein